MIPVVVAFGLLLHVVFWGVGIAMLGMPRPWRRFWPILILPAGLALQSAVVWFGAKAGLPGTNLYAVWTELIPFALLLAGVRVRGPGALKDVTRFGVVWASVAACLALLVLPVVIASRSLTTISLGSCDAADYAAGARVLMEFSSADRDGFIGLTEVVRVQSVDNFFDYWTRLNHFTPSALMAFNGSILGCAPHELATLMTAVLVAGLLPMVFWMSRAVIGYSGGVSVIVAGLFGISPILWYAYAHVSPGQLLAAQAVSLLTWAGVALWRGRLTWARAVQFFGVMAAGYWLVLGSYNFFLLVCLVPAVAYAGGLALWRRAWRRFGAWLLFMVVPLVGCGALFAERMAGLAERFRLLRAYDFGWPVPGLSAEGWLGMVRGPDLAPWDFFGLRWLLAAAAVGLLAWAVLRAARERQRALWLAIAVTAPILAAYLALEIRAAHLGTNASYDAYKLFAVFYPLTLPAFCWWVTLRRSRRLHEWLLVCVVAGVVVAFNLLGCALFVWNLSRPPLTVDRELRQLRAIEAMSDVKGVNLRIPDMWSRLWAHALLLRKEQFFPTHTYEGRLNTPLRGEWDLEGGLIDLELPGDSRRAVNPRFTLVDTRHPAFVRADLGEGWHPEEFDPRSLERWRWTRAAPELRVHNPHAYPVILDIRIDAWSAAPRSMRAQVGGAPPGAEVAIGRTRGPVSFPPVTVPPGDSTVTLTSGEPLTTVPGDSRPLGASVFKVRIAPRRP